jgi:hypothetical protein
VEFNKDVSPKFAFSQNFLFDAPPNSYESKDENNGRRRSWSALLGS